MSTSSLVFENSRAHDSGAGATGGCSACDILEMADGKPSLIVTAGWDCLVRAWDASSGDAKGIKTETQAWVYALRIIAPNLVAVACSGGMFPDENTLLRVFDVTSGEMRRCLRHHKRGVHSLDVLETRLASASKDSVAMWDMSAAATTSDEALAPTWHNAVDDEVAGVCMMPGLEQVAVGLRGKGRVVVHDVTTSTTSALQTRSSDVRDVAGIPALGPVVAAAAQDAWCVFDVRVSSPVASLPAHGKMGPSTLRSDARAFLATGGMDDPKQRRWTTAQLALVHPDSNVSSETCNGVREPSHTPLHHAPSCLLTHEEATREAWRRALRRHSDRRAYADTTKTAMLVMPAGH
ncbi:hypothetical protein NFJ02_03g100400 [Pycnococcus provasolii]